MKKISIFFSTVLELGIPPDLIFLQTRDLELCFARKIIKIGWISSEPEFFEVGDFSNCPENFVFHGFSLVNQRWFTKEKPWKTKFSGQFEKSPTSKNSGSLDIQPILIIFLAKQSSRSLVCRKIKSGGIPSSRTVEKKIEIFFIGKFPICVSNYLEREIWQRP